MKLNPPYLYQDYELLQEILIFKRINKVMLPHIYPLSIQAQHSMVLVGSSSLWNRWKSWLINSEQINESVW